VATRRYRGQKYEAQLQKDLASGPVAYRKVPGSRRYYNPKTGETVSEDYVVRIYRKQVSPQELRVMQYRSKVLAQSNRQVRDSLGRTYWAKLQADKVISTEQVYRSSQLNQYGFNNVYTRLRAVSYNARYQTLDSPERKAAYAADGEYAQLLVALGRRLPEETFMVGDSPKEVGGGSYIDNVVLPALSQQANS
jgi:hypothetical protein